MEAQKVQVRLFLGLALTKNLELQLSESSHWKRAQLLHAHSLSELEIALFGKKAHLGTFLKYEAPSLKELKQSEAFVRQRLHSYLPEVKIKPFSVCLLTQVFIA